MVSGIEDPHHPTQHCTELETCSNACTDVDLGMMNCLQKSQPNLFFHFDHPSQIVSEANDDVIVVVPTIDKLFKHTTCIFELSFPAFLGYLIDVFWIRDIAGDEY